MDSTVRSFLQAYTLTCNQLHASAAVRDFRLRQPIGMMPKALRMLMQPFKHADAARVNALVLTPKNSNIIYGYSVELCQCVLSYNSQHDIFAAANVGISLTTPSIRTNTALVGVHLLMCSTAVYPSFASSGLLLR